MNWILQINVDELNARLYPTITMADWTSAEPVSSTLAAELAPHLSSQGNPVHRLTRESFAQLRQELVEGKYSQLSLDDSVTDVSRLICVVLKAGLEPCTKNKEPGHGDLSGQLSDCLDIIQIAVEKVPQTLTEVPDPEILGVRAYAPLYAWLVVQLLHLSCTQNNWTVDEKVSRIFSTIVRAQYKHTKLWSHYHAIPTFLRACANGL